ncbi:hypothetical protein BDA96_02G426200 [Sorghum bicolor]|uniref:Uncharacterized protein n=1 Tax=Sorghum bicolor TaxID=4558 RepID=A0A921RUZ7_SORBI|nr:hypothetical protein BDA96_02G426200 [Sorghum bicolor]
MVAGGEGALLLARLVDGAAGGAPAAGVVRRLVRVPLLLRRRRGDDSGGSPGGADAERPEHVEVVPGRRRRLGGLVVVDVGRVEEVVGVDHVEEVDGVIGEKRGDVEVVRCVGGKGGVVGGLVELVLAEPVVAEPSGGLDELPPLGREVLHLPVRRRDEERRVRVQRRRRHGCHGAHPLVKLSFDPDLDLCSCLPGTTTTNKHADRVRSSSSRLLPPIRNRTGIPILGSFLSATDLRQLA